MCLDLHNQFVLYTFNPYAQLAPELWNIIKDNYTIDASWALLEHRFEQLPESKISYGKYFIYFNKFAAVKGYIYSASYHLCNHQFNNYTLCICIFENQYHR